MFHSRILGIAVILQLLSNVLIAADDAVAVHVTQGIIEKVEKESLTIKPRAANGKFDKSLVFKLTGTSRFSMVSKQKRGDNIVFVQMDMEVKQLAEKQSIALIYAKNEDANVILTGVHHAD